MRTPRSRIALTSCSRSFNLILLTVLWFGIATSSDNVMADNLRFQLETLAADRDFRIQGVEHLRDENSTNLDGEKLTDQINLLLANYNFVVTRDTQNRIAQLTIVGLRVKPRHRPLPPEYIKTERHHSEHYVEAVLTGPNGRDLPLKFMVDTGASTLVLPQSLANTLGYAPGDLESVRVQTANGKTMGRTATLQSVRVGEAESERVAVTFVDDHLLGGKRLLGMSFLGRFRMTIDGNNGVLQLEKQRE